MAWGGGLGSCGSCSRCCGTWSSSRREVLLAASIMLLLLGLPLLISVAPGDPEWNQRMLCAGLVGLARTRSLKKGEKDGGGPGGIKRDSPDISFEASSCPRVPCCSSQLSCASLATPTIT
jgi:hypothetical protein